MDLSIDFHRTLIERGIGAKDWLNTFTEVEYLHEGKFAASVSVGHRVFKDKTDNKWKKRKLTDNRPDHVVVQSAMCCVEVYPFYAKYFDVHHEDVRLYEERWIVQRLFKEPDDWRDVDAYNPIMVVEEYSEPIGDVVKVIVTYDTDYGILTVEYFQRDGNALKHNVYFTNTSGETETFRVLQRWSGITGEKCNGKTVEEVGFRNGICHSEILPKIISYKPSSVLDVGGRGELVKILNERNIPATCMDKSELNGTVTDTFILHDATVIPYPFANNEFDLCTGIGLLKYVPEEKLDSVLREIARISKRGLFFLGEGFRCPPTPENIVLDRSLEWWQVTFQSVVPNYPVELQLITAAEVFLVFHQGDDLPRTFIISESLQSMVSNPDGSKKIDKCLQGSAIIESHSQGLKGDFIYGCWTLAQDEELRIDPTTETIYTGNDSYVSLSYGATSYAFLRFDISGIPPEQTIDLAQLYFYVTSIGGSSDYDMTYERITNQSCNPESDTGETLLGYGVDSATNWTGIDTATQWYNRDVKTPFLLDYDAVNTYHIIRLHDPDNEGSPNQVTPDGDFLITGSAVAVEDIKIASRESANDAYLYIEYPPYVDPPTVTTQDATGIGEGVPP